MGLLRREMFALVSGMFDWNELNFLPTQITGTFKVFKYNVFGLPTA